MPGSHDHWVLLVFAAFWGVALLWSLWKNNDLALGSSFFMTLGLCWYVGLALSHQLFPQGAATMPLWVVMSFLTWQIPVSVLISYLVMMKAFRHTLEIRERLEPKSRQQRSVPPVTLNIC